MILTKPCLLSMKNLSKDGYSRIYVGGFGYKHELAHRIALAKKLGRPILPGYQACHHCDVPNCIEPEHLFEGTQSDNLQDASRKGHFKGHWENAR